MLYRKEGSKEGAMPIATVTSKGQVTIPKEIREKLGIITGDELDFDLNSDGTVSVRRKTKGRLEDLCGIIQRRRKNPLSVEGMHEAVIDAVVSSFKP
jgi:AbrB family looped-hinge helix DNA binding protein